MKTTPQLPNPQKDVPRLLRMIRKLDRVKPNWMALRCRLEERKAIAMGNRFRKARKHKSAYGWDCSAMAWNEAGRWAEVYGEHTEAVMQEKVDFGIEFACWYHKKDSRQMSPERTDFLVKLRRHQIYASAYWYYGPDEALAKAGLKREEIDSELLQKLHQLEMAKPVPWNKKAQAAFAKSHHANTKAWRQVEHDFWLGSRNPDKTAGRVVDTDKIRVHVRSAQDYLARLLETPNATKRALIADGIAKRLSVILAVCGVGKQRIARKRAGGLKSKSCSKN